MRALIDTDILIDVALDRQPFVEQSSEVLEYLERFPGIGFVAWHSVSNFYYLVSANSTKGAARQFINELIQFVDVATVTTADLQFALSLPLTDFEDAMQVSCAVACKADRIITRNLKHYKKSPIPAESPTEFLDSL